LQQKKSQEDARKKEAEKIKMDKEKYAENILQSFEKIENTTEKLKLPFFVQGPGIARLVKCVKNAAFYISSFHQPHEHAQFSVKISPDKKATISMEDKKDGTYLVVYNPKVSGDYRVTIQCISGEKFSEETYDVTVERQDRWQIKGLDPRMVYQPFEPIPFTIEEKEIMDFTTSVVMFGSLLVEIRDPQNQTERVIANSSENLSGGLQFCVEFTPKIIGQYKIMLYYKDVLIGDLIRINVGSRRFGATTIPVPSTIKIEPITGVTQVSLPVNITPSESSNATTTSGRKWWLW